MAKIEKWKTIDSSILFESGLCSLYSEKCELPDGRIMPQYYVFDCPDWVQILPITKEGNIILVEQFRQGNQQIGLEIPGGTLDTKNKEAPLLAAKREMEEETGYTTEKIELVCSHSPNPALFRNQIHLYIARNAELKYEQQLDPYEEISVHTYAPSQIPELISSAQIHHSVVLASLLFLKDQIGF